MYSVVPYVYGGAAQRKKGLPTRSILAVTHLRQCRPTSSHDACSPRDRRGRCCIPCRRWCFLRCGAAAGCGDAGHAHQDARLGSYLLEGVSECMLGTMTWGEQNSEAEALRSWTSRLPWESTSSIPPSSTPCRPTASPTARQERIIGRWLAADPRRRAQLVLATKAAGDGRDHPHRAAQGPSRGLHGRCRLGLPTRPRLPPPPPPPPPRPRTPARKSGLWRADPRGAGLVAGTAADRLRGPLPAALAGAIHAHL